MSPWELCKGGTEHGHQRALFAWSKMAEMYGFECAWDKQTYEAGGMLYAESTYGTANACWPLKWFHATPNGGSLGDSKQSQQIRGAQKKAEGVKAGVYDTFLPWVQYLPDNSGYFRYAGLWLEMKKPGEIKKRSLEQKAFGTAMTNINYACAVADNWEDAARCVQLYMSGGVIECPVHNAN